MKRWILLFGIVLLFPLPGEAQQQKVLSKLWVVDRDRGTIQPLVLPQQPPYEGQGYSALGTWKAFGVDNGLDGARLNDILLQGDWLYIAGSALSKDGKDFYGLVRVHIRTQQVEVLAHKLEFLSTQGWIKKLIPYRGGIIAVGAFTSLDGRYARSLAYWKDGQWTIIPSRVEGTLFGAAVIEDTLYADALLVQEPGMKIYQYMRGYNLATMERLPIIGKLGRDKGIAATLEYVAVGKKLCVFGFFDRVIYNGDLDTLEAHNAAVYDIVHRQWEVLPIALDSFPTIGLRTLVVDTLLYVYGEQLGGQRHLYQIDVQNRRVEE